MYYFQDDIKAMLGEKKPEGPKVQVPSPKLHADKKGPAPEEAPKEYNKLKPVVGEKNQEPIAKEELQQLQEKLVKSDADPAKPATAPAVNTKSKEADWNALRAKVVDLLDDEKWDDGSWGPVFVRLAWHAAGTYDAKSKRGGSEGALMRFKPEMDWGANAGLAFARARLEPLKKEFPEISFADLWSFAGSVAIEEMGGPKINWRPGRKDIAETAPFQMNPDGLLPDADGRDKKERIGDHLRDIFYRMGFNDREIVALSGAHALGRCHTDRSGYWGPWTNAPTTFSNEYFRLLLEEKWTPKTTHLGKPWKGPMQYEDKTGNLMMLPTDVALVQDAKFRPIVEEYAKNEKKFFDDFAKAWIKLQENGVRKFHGTRRYWLFGPRE